jgi:hypothetical protein
MIALEVVPCGLKLNARQTLADARRGRYQDLTMKQPARPRQRSWQLLNGLVGHGRQVLLQIAQRGVGEIRRQLQQGQQHEGPLMQARMRQSQFGAGKVLATHQQQVQVQCSRRMVEGTLPAVGQLQRLKLVQQLQR